VRSTCSERIISIKIHSAVHFTSYYNQNYCAKFGLRELKSNTVKRKFT
jgi:hypothetical protein